MGRETSLRLAASPRPLLAALLLTVTMLLPALTAAEQGSEPVTDPDTGVRAWPELDRLPAQHVDGEVLYQMVPPAGGPHNAIWQSCGYYSEPIYNWHGVHALEHGAVWITYDPTLPATEVQRLTTLANVGYIIVSPYPGLPSPVVASAWGRQIRLDGANDPRLQQFIVEFRRNPEIAPEPNATCSLGTVETMLAGETPQVEPSIVSGTPDEIAAAEASAPETPASSPDPRGEYKEQH